MGSKFLFPSAFFVFLVSSIAIAGINYSSITSPSPGTIKVYVTASCTNITGTAVYVNGTWKAGNGNSGGVASATVTAPAGSDYVVVKFWNSAGSVCAQTSKTVTVAATSTSTLQAHTFTCSDATSSFKIFTGTDMSKIWIGASADGVFYTYSYTAVTSTSGTYITYTFDNQPYYSTVIPRAMFYPSSGVTYYVTNNPGGHVVGCHL